MRKPYKITAGLWLRSGRPPEITVRFAGAHSRQVVTLSLEEAERLRNVIRGRLAEARFLEIPIEGSAP